MQNLHPVVTGPIAGGQRGYPMSSFPGDLAPFGYLEEEFFVCGVATSFRSDGPFDAPGDDAWRAGYWQVKPLARGAYTIRILVQRPADPAHFNGTVLVEWSNVSPGSEFLLMPDPAIYRGAILVAASVQSVGIYGFRSEEPEHREGMRQWDPERYAALNHPGDSFSFDIFSQVGRALRGARMGADPLGGLIAEKVIAIGGSQSAMRIRTHINALHLKEQVFDAYVSFLDYGNCVDLGDAVFEPHIRTPAFKARVFRHPVRIRDDIGVPVCVVNSEKEAQRWRDGDRGFLLQPDTGKFRLWEVAGAAHLADLPADRVAYVRVARRDGLRGPRKRWPVVRASDRPGSTVSVQPTVLAALDHLARAIGGGAMPPVQPRLEFTPATGRKALPEPKRDTLGIAVGGIRLPETDVPIAMNTGFNDEPGQAENRGLSQPFSHDLLRELYRDHADYVAKVVIAAKAALARGVILPDRVEAYIAAAKAETIFDHVG